MRARRRSGPSHDSIPPPDLPAPEVPCEQFAKEVLRDRIAVLLDIWPQTFILCSLRARRAGVVAIEEFPFKVVRTNGHDEVLARSINLLIGRAAFETAKRMYPKDLIEYRKGAMVLDKSDGEGG
jgi:hypothetical protein